MASCTDIRIEYCQLSDTYLCIDCNFLIIEIIQQRKLCDTTNIKIKRVFLVVLVISEGKLFSYKLSAVV
jgi:hypothetical protein